MQTCAIKLYRHSLASKKEYFFVKAVATDGCDPTLYINCYNAEKSKWKFRNKFIVEFPKMFDGGSVPTELSRQLNSIYHKKNIFMQYAQNFILMLS